jgi:hypothetical protein
MTFSLKSIGGVAAVLVLSACASQPPVRFENIQSASYMRPNENAKSGHDPYTYSTDVDWRSYTNFIMDPVAVYTGTDAQFVKVTDQEKDELAKYMQQSFREKLAQRFVPVSTPRAHTVRIKVTLTGAKPTKQVLGTFTKFDIGGAPYNAVQAARGRQGLFTGSVSYAVEIFDASSNKLLKAYVDTQYPNAMNVKATFGALHAAKTGIDKAADKVVLAVD